MISTFILLASFSNNHMLPIETLTLPPKYSIKVVAQADNVRQLALAPDGTLFAGSRSKGSVYAFIDQDKDGVYEQTITLAHHLNMPSGIAFSGNDLYVAEVSRILKFSQVLPLTPNVKLAPETYFDKLPNKRHHGWKYLKFGPDQSLYFNIGAPCNTCLSESPYASIAKLDTQKRLSIVAKGVRNSVGFAWDPKTEHLWFTDNGRDYLGDDIPSDELNRVDKTGLHFGFPFMHGNNIPDSTFSPPEDGKYTLPAYLLGAHVAPLGMTFIHQEPSSKQQSLLIAEHGSWNRSQKVGYRIVKLQIEGGKVTSNQPFISGWLKGEKHWGRPNDIIEDRDGSLLISDDFAGVIYRVSMQ